jgi:hypothetical protein
MILLIIGITLLTSLLDLPAFSYLLRTALPALLVAIPVIFAPEIRRALERIGRAGTILTANAEPTELEARIDAIVTGAQRLTDHYHGALIVIEREVLLQEYIVTAPSSSATTGSWPRHACCRSPPAGRCPARPTARWACGTVPRSGSARSATQWRSWFRRSAG